MFEVNYKNFRVICQNCGRTGIINTTRYQDGNSPFFLRYDDGGRRGREFGERIYDVFLCAECLGVETKR